MNTRRERAETKTEAEEEGGGRERAREGGRERRREGTQDLKTASLFFFFFFFALTFHPGAQTLASARRGPAPATPPASRREREDISASARLDTRGGTAT